MELPGTHFEDRQSRLVDFRELMKNAVISKLFEDLAILVLRFPSPNLFWGVNPGFSVLAKKLVASHGLFCPAVMRLLRRGCHFQITWVPLQVGLGERCNDAADNRFHW